MNCRLCGAPARKLDERPDVVLLRCPACTFVSGQPRATAPTAEQYRHYYRGEPPPSPDRRYEEWLSEAERRIGVGRLLEVGSGGGGFVRVAVRRGWSVWANEVSETGLGRLRDSGAKIAPGRIEDVRFADGEFDLVVSLEVIEHLPTPLPHLRELARITRTGGLLLMTTPNFGGLSRRWLGIRWRVIEPGHLGYFTPGTLEAALRHAGYRESRIRSRSLDVSTWRRTAMGRRDEPARFDPHASARLRDAVESRSVLRSAKAAVNSALGFTGLGDSLLAWAVR